jgi:hypothetical protein
VRREIANNRRKPGFDVLGGIVAPDLQKASGGVYPINGFK